MRQLIHIAVLAGLGLALAGCGHRPLYGGSSDNSSVVQQLSDVSIEEQKSRAGQLVRNELISAFGASGSSRYLLKMSAVEKTDSVSSVPGTTVERFRYRLNVSYQLVDASSGEEVAGGKTFSNAAYDTVREPVADLQAAENARERAARELAQDLRLRLSAFFANRES
jgi:LPS-assembly lipoprotein